MTLGYCKLECINLLVITFRKLRNKISFTMSKKSLQQEYKRRWAATTRHLKRQRERGQNTLESEDSDQECELSLPTFSTAEAVAVAQSESEVANASPIPCAGDLGNSDAHSDSESEIWVQHVTLSSDAESDNESDLDSFQDKLALWATDFQVKHNALDSLLRLLKKSGHPDLPTTASTLLHTVTEVQTEIKSDMSYYYFGVASELLKHFKMYPVHERAQVDGLEISLNIDGLPLFRSSQMEFWPVLCAIVNMHPNIVFPVALTCGKSKPKNLDFLTDTIEKLKVVLQSGLKDGEDTISVILRCIVCDAPAKAMVKNTKLFSGYSGCDKCSQQGQYFGRMTYQEIMNLNLRTDDSFCSQSYPQHHHGPSPFCQLPINMIKAFPVHYMHQVCLGVMKRLLLVWIRGKRNVKHSADHIQQISDRLEMMTKCIPARFAIKPRSLREVDRWKATEYRQFLLYTGKLALRNILRPDLYDNFMTLSVALSILVSPKLSENHRDYAHKLLEHFVTQARNLYGKEFLVYDVHAMLHLADEVKEHGSLDACSAFPFENYMQKLKKSVRSGNNPLVQVVRRLSERRKHIEKSLNESPKVSTTPPNNAFILDGHLCCEATQVTDTEQNYLCRVYEHGEAVFTKPCDSRLLQIYRVNRRNADRKSVV